MLTEKQQQAKNLYFQTDLNKTQIADLLNISRRSLHYWIRENNWDRLKHSATLLPAMLAENCYLIISKYTESILKEDRIMRPVTAQEADTLHKLTLTAKKLKNHSTLNESMEIFAHLLERVNQRSPELADQLMPFVNEYMEDRARIHPRQFLPERLNEQGLIPIVEKDITETQKDIADLFAWEDEQRQHEQQVYPIDHTHADGRHGTDPAEGDTPGDTLPDMDTLEQDPDRTIGYTRNDEPDAANELFSTLLNEDPDDATFFELQNKLQDKDKARLRDALEWYRQIIHDDSGRSAA